jgi:superfamily II DNA or RNA helicase
MLNVTFKVADIVAAVGPTSFGRGRDYQLRGKVIDLVAKDHVIEARVAGSGNNNYSQTIRLRARKRDTVVDGHCSCPMDHNCKHVAAVLLAYLVRAVAALKDAAGAAGDTDSAAALPPNLTAWTQEMGAMAAAPAFARTQGGPYRMIYVLAQDDGGAAPELLACRARLGAGGAVAGATILAELSDVVHHRPAYMDDADVALMRVFVALRGADWSSPRVTPSDTLGGHLLRLLLDGGHLFWTDDRLKLKSGALRQLTPGGERAGTLAWRPGAGGELQLGWHCDDGGTIDAMVPTTPPFYIAGGDIGPLRLDLPPSARPLKALTAMVHRAPTVSAAHAPALAKAMQARGMDASLPLPYRARHVQRDDIAPRPLLQLESIELTDGSFQRVAHDYALLAFDYDGMRTTAAADAPLERATVDGSEVIARDGGAEKAAIASLAALGFAPAAGPLKLLNGALALGDAASWQAFERAPLARLRAQGWQVEMAPAYRYNVVEIDDWVADVAENAENAEDGGSAWFSLDLGIVVDGARVALLPLLVQMIRAAPRDFDPAAMALHADGATLLARLADGRRVALPWSRVRPILATLGELYFSDRVGDSVTLPEIDAARLAELEAGAQLRWLGGERLRALGRKLARFDGVQPVTPPLGLQATLRAYQGEGLAWMQFLREYGFGGILADDMGLGKTVQTLAHILLEKEAGRLTAPALVVAPTSLMGNWQAEAARFAPGLRVLLLHGAERAARFAEIGAHDLVLTTYALLARDEMALRAQPFHLLILDESQYIKNSRAKAAHSATMLDARHRLCLTGTPVQNHLGELWSQFHFLMPGLLGDEKSFGAEYRKPIEKGGDCARKDLLVRRIRPFLLRRTKDAVASELPPKTQIVREVDLGSAQRDLYETVRLAMDAKVRAEIARKGVARSQIVILEALLKLRQVCCDPRLVGAAAAKGKGKAKPAAPSAKLAELMVMLDELRDEGRAVLVFSQFTSMLALIEDELKARAMPYALLTGDTRDRDAQVGRFQRGEVALFLISLKAGGVGLNLTAADTVIHYDPWWNPAAEDQATDRAWRIGQDKPVFVYKLIAKGTLEEKLQELQRDKAALADAVLGAGQVQGARITESDLRAIFGPS